MPVLEPDFDKIPKQFRDQRRWILWTEEMVGGRLTKVPRQANGTHAKTNMPTTWATFERVRAAYATGKFSGIGYCRADDEVFIDLDACFDEHGNWRRWAWTGPQPEEIYNALKAYAYAEKSPSTTGLHMIVRASEMPATLKVGIRGEEHSGYECYPSTARFLTVSGAQVSLGDLTLDAGAAIAEINARVIAAHEEQTHAAKATNGNRASQAQKPAENRANPAENVQNVHLSDGELIEKACREPEFRQLWFSGSWKGDYPSQSEADLYLCQRLAFWTGYDVARIDALYRQSGLFRNDDRPEKWDSSRPDGTYGSDTINFACGLTSDTYTPRPRGRPKGAEAKNPKKAKAASASAGSGSLQRETAGGQTGGEGKFSGEGMSEPPANGSRAEAEALFHYALTDVGNAERFRDRFGANLRYATPLKTWLRWGADPQWKPDDTSYALQLGIAQAQALTHDAEVADYKALVRFSLQSQSAGKIESMLNLAKALDGIAISVDDLDRDPWLLNNLTGAIALKQDALKTERT